MSLTIIVCVLCELYVSMCACVEIKFSTHGGGTTGRSTGECARGTSQWVPSSGWPCGFVLCEVGKDLQTLCPTFLNDHVELRLKTWIGSQMTRGMSELPSEIG